MDDLPDDPTTEGFVERAEIVGAAADIDFMDGIKGGNEASTR